MKSNKKPILIILLAMVTLLTFSIFVSCTAIEENKEAFMIDEKVDASNNIEKDTTVLMPPNPTEEDTFTATQYVNGAWKTTGDVPLAANLIDVGNTEFNGSNNLVSFTCGEYPQTIKTDDVTITETLDSRGYYLGSDGAYYAQVTSKPYNSKYTFSNGKTITSGETYYFKVEPIKWKVLNNSNGTYTVISDLILDSQCYYESSSSRNEATDYQGNSSSDKVYANNYKYSDIRTFLNTSFLNSAFTSAEQAKIQTTEVDNSVSSTGYSSNNYACDNTQDKIFLLSYSEATNTGYGFNSDSARYAKSSDYAKARAFIPIQVTMKKIIKTEMPFGGCVLLIAASIAMCAVLL